jgi:hypothetical protein
MAQITPLAAERLLLAQKIVLDNETQVRNLHRKLTPAFQSLPGIIGAALLPQKRSARWVCPSRKINGKPC